MRCSFRKGITSSVVSISFSFQASLSSVMSLSLVATPISSFMRVSSSWSKRSVSIFRLPVSIELREPAIFSRVLPSLSRM